MDVMEKEHGWDPVLNTAIIEDAENTPSNKGTIQHHCGEGYTSEGQYVVHEPDPDDYYEGPFMNGFHSLNFEF